MADPSASAEGGTDAPEWLDYNRSHHGHVGLEDAHPLRQVEFEAGVLPHLPPGPISILEIGCGRGATLAALRRAGFDDLHGWDIAQDCLDAARAAGVDARLEHCDALDGLAECAPGSFDAIVAKDLVEHLPREQVVEFVRGVHRALRPGGVFIARLPNMANPLAVLLRYDDFTHRLGFTENSMRQVFTLGGFPRTSVDVRADVIPASALLRRGMWIRLFHEAVLGPLVRLAMRVALRSQRKGPPRVDTLRLWVVATKPASATEGATPTP